MDNLMTMPVFKRIDGKIQKLFEQVEGRAFEFCGVALHIRKIGSLWVISLFNSGLLTRGSGKTLHDAMDAYIANEGQLIEKWKQERGIKHLYDYRQTCYIEANTEQELDLKFNEQTCRLVTGKKLKAGYLI